MDLEGKLIIKVRLEDDVRVIPIHNEDITYDELLVMMQRIYNGKLNADDEVLIKYRDEDADMVTIFDSNDLALAIAMSRLLKLTLYVKPKLKNLDYEDIWKIRASLRAVRATVDKLIERLDLIEAPSPVPDDNAKAAGDKTAEEEKHVEVRSVCSKEFDPLEQGDRSDSASTSSAIEELQAAQLSHFKSGKAGAPGQPMMNGVPSAPTPPAQAAQLQQQQVPMQQYQGYGQQSTSHMSCGVSSTASLPTQSVSSAGGSSGGYYSPHQQPGQQMVYPGQPRPTAPPPQAYQGAPPAQGPPQGQQMPPQGQQMPPQGQQMPPQGPQPYPVQQRPLYPGQQPPQQQQQGPPGQQMNFQPLRPPTAPGYPTTSTPTPAPAPGMQYYQQPQGSPGHYPQQQQQQPPQQLQQQQGGPPQAPPTSLAPPPGAPPASTPPLGAPPMGPSPAGGRVNPYSARGVSAYGRPQYPTFQPQQQQ